MTFRERWQSFSHGGGTAGPRTLGWMERTIEARPECAYVGEDAILVALPAHERLIDLYMAATDAEALDRALVSGLPGVMAAVGPEPVVVAKGSEGHRLAPYGFEQIDDLLYYVKDPLEAGVPDPDVREATMDDFAVVLAIDHAAFPQPYQRGPREMEVHIEGTSIVRIACDGSDVIGFAILQPLGDRYHLGAIGVHPDRQGQGWGRRLLQDALAIAHMKGAGSVGLTTQVSNMPSRVLYERAGMVSTPLGPVWARGKR